MRVGYWKMAQLIKYLLFIMRTRVPIFNIRVNANVAWWHVCDVRAQEIEVETGYLDKLAAKLD